MSESESSSMTNFGTALTIATRHMDPPRKMTTSSTVVGTTIDDSVQLGFGNTNYTHSNFSQILPSMENRTQWMIPSPKGHTSICSSSSVVAAHHLPSLPVARFDQSNPYPTTFVQADTSSFKQVVQMLTGSAETARLASSRTETQTPRNPIPPVKTTGLRKDKSSSKLYERRNSLKNFKISPLAAGMVSLAGCTASPRGRTPEILSPSILDFPSLMLSPVTPLIPDLFRKSPDAAAVAEEEKAIQEKGFYFHPSPVNTPREAVPPRLLPLFPVTSPRVGDA